MRETAAIKEHGAELEGDEAESKLLQHRGGDGGVFTAQAELRLDQFLPGIEVFFDLAREDLAELGVDAADVGGQCLHGGEENDKEDDGEGHGF